MGGQSHDLQVVAASCDMTVMQTHKAASGLVRPYAPLPVRTSRRGYARA
jgi:hypothetical protein